MRKKDVRGVIADYLPWLILSLVLLAILMISIFIEKGVGISWIDKIKSILR